MSPQVVRDSKGTLFEGGVWVPCIVSGPATAAPLGRTNDSLIHAVDIFETILDFVGVDPVTAVPEGTQIDSLSFAPYLVSPDFPSCHTYSFTARFTSPSSSGDGMTIRNRRYKLIRFDSGDEMLFDLSRDPVESTDLLAKRTLKARAQSNYEALTALLDDLVGGVDGE